MKNQENDTFSLAQGKYPWGIVKNQTNSKFVEIGYRSDCRFYVAFSDCKNSRNNYSGGQSVFYKQYGIL